MGMEHIENRHGNRPDTLWFTRCPVPTASAIAIRLGWLNDEFAADDIAVRSLRHAKELSVRESHFTHTLANSFRQGGNAPALFARSEGADTALLGLNLVDQYQGLLVHPKSNITSVQQLRGKRLALPTRTKDKIDFWRATHLQVYESILRQAGMTFDDVVLVTVEVPHSYLDVFAEVADNEVDVPRLSRQHLAECVALLRDEVDAMIGYSAWGVELREQFGLRQLAKATQSDRWEDHVNNGYPETLTVSAPLLREHPDLVDRYVSTLQRAVVWASERADETCRILAQEIGVAQYWLREGTTLSIAFSLGERELAALENRKRFLLQNGFIRSDFDLQTWIDDGPLTRARGRGPR
jgi:ABC-type nitrate/sulfonate/bicarbonate transport system substrate-binding protein